MAKRVEVTYRPRTMPRGKERFEWDPPENASDVQMLMGLLRDHLPEVPGPNLVTDIRILTIRRDWMEESSVATEPPSTDIFAVVLVTCDGEHVDFRGTSVEGVYKIHFFAQGDKTTLEIYPLENQAGPSIYLTEGEMSLR